MVSTDGGNTWEEKYSNYIFNDLKMLNNDQILMIGDMGLIIESSNFGIDWQFLSTTQPDFPGYLLDIKFVDDQSGIAVGQNGIILKTSNGGNSWNSLPSGTLDDLIEITYLDANRIVILGINRFENHSILLKTENGGMNWESKIFENVLYYDMFINENIGILIGDLGKILRSTDSLKTWVGISSGTTKRLDAISISDNLYGMVVGENGEILKTSDGGLTWANIQNLPIRNYSDIVCFNQNSAIVIGDLGTILKTLNAGANWNPISINTTSNLSSISFFNNNSGMISCDNGVILKTSNEGYSWQLQQTITDNYLLGVYIKDNYSAWTVGGPGYSVLHTTNGGVTFIEDEKNYSTQPKEFLLQQNYPNPFNPSTKISWQSPVGSWQTLKVYDILGNEVATLVDEYRNAGSYNEQFTINNVQLSSGVYFYQLRVGDYLETKKMILLK